MKDKNCRECDVKLTTENTKAYRLKNYVYLCNDCERDQKRQAAAEYRKQNSSVVAFRSRRHNEKTRKENPVRYTVRQ